MQWRFFLMFCRYIVPTRVLVCLCNELRAIKCSLSGCFKRWLLYGGFFCYYCVLSSVCILKRPFSLHNFRQYTNICARVCLCFFADASCLSLHTTSALSSSFASIINEKKTHLFRVTLLLFLAAFSTANRKIQKGKVQPFLFKFNV